MLSLKAQTASKALEYDKIQWKYYTTFDKTIRAKIPNNWEADEKFMSFNLFIKAPYEGEADDFAENISVYLQEIKGGGAQERLESYYNEAKNQTLRLLGNGSMSKPRFFTLKGAPACEFICIADQDGTKLKWKQLSVIKGDKICTITFTAFDKDFARYVQIADIIMQSMEITIK